MTDMEKERLLPCPFCGAHAGYDFPDDVCWCANSECEMHSHSMDKEQWNTRAAQPAPTAAGSVEAVMPSSFALADEILITIKDLLHDKTGLISKEHVKNTILDAIEIHTESAKNYGAKQAALSHAPAPADGWQPIETAPRDDTTILGWYVTRDGGTKDLWSIRAVYYCTIDECWCFDTAMKPVENSCWHLTHWMPLPAPPSQHQAAQEGK